MLRVSFAVVLLAGSLAGQPASAPGMTQSGVVRSLGRPIPGASITAVQGGRKVVTTTDESGRYELDGLAPGDWTIEVDMVAFAPVRRQRTISDLAPPALDFDLELGTAVAAKQAEQPKPPGPPASVPSTPSAKPAAQTAQQQRPQRGPGGPGGQRQGDGFRNLNVNQTADNDLLAQMNAQQGDGAMAATGDASGASEAFLMNGSVTSGLQGAQQQDFFDQRRAEFDQRRGMFGGGDPNNPGSFGGDPNVALGGPGGGPGGPGGPGGGPGGRGGGPGGPGGFSGRGGPGGGGPGGFGGRGGPGGYGGRGGFERGRGGPESSRSRGGFGPPVFGNRSSRGRGGLRGMAFFTLGNSALDARSYSLTGQTVDKPSYASSRFGISLFGPLTIPKLVKSDPKTFLFLNYFGTRARNPYNATATLPTAAERAGDFSQSFVRGVPVQLFDPTTHAPIPGNRFPSAMLNSAAIGLLRFIPLPNQPGTVQNYQYLTSTNNNSNNLSTRLNRTLNRKNRLDGSFNLQDRNSVGATLFGFRDPGSGRGINTGIGWTHNFTTRTINSLRFNFSRNRNETIPFFAYGEDVSGELGILGVSNSPINYGPPNLSFTNFGGLTDASAVLVRNQTAGVSESLSFARGPHNLSVGGEFRRTQLNTITDSDARGTFSFSGVATSAYSANGQVVPNTGYDFADFLLGLPQSSSRRFGDTSTYFRASVFNGFAVDDWRMKTNLTLNLGLRYEFFTPYSEKYNHIANLDIAPGFTAVAGVLPGEAGPYSGVFPAGLVDPDKNNFSPRVGIAWRPFPKHSTLIRAGVGMFFNGSVYNQFPSRLAAQPPFAATASLVTSTANVLTLQNGFATAPSTKITNTYAVDRNYKVGFAQTWNVSLQQTLPHNLTLETTYLGTKGTRLDIQVSPNTAAPGSPLTTQQRLSIANAGLFTFDTSNGNSIYHAFTTRFNRRFTRGLSLSTTYTFSKSIDNASSIGGGGATVAQNYLNLAAERGLSSFDQRHTFTSFFVLTSPVGETGLLRGSGWAERLLKDWTLNGGATASSGTPFTARVLGNQANAGGTGTVGAGRAQATGLPVDGAVGFFNPLAFVVPLPGTLGDAGRNTILGIPRYSINLSFGRSFRLDDRRRLEFRVDSSNFLNHANYTAVGTVVNASNYGFATNTGNMRTITAQLRLRF